MLYFYVFLTIVITTLASYNTLIRICYKQNEQKYYFQKSFCFLLYASRLYYVTLHMDIMKLQNHKTDFVMWVTKWF